MSCTLICHYTGCTIFELMVHHSILSLCYQSVNNSPHSTFPPLKNIQYSYSRNISHSLFSLFSGEERGIGPSIKTLTVCFVDTVPNSSNRNCCLPNLKCTQVFFSTAQRKHQSFWFIRLNSRWYSDCHNSNES